jgi:hypothetical protein
LIGARRLGRHVRHGTNRSNRLGLRAKLFRNKSRGCSRTFQHLPFGDGLEFPAGTRVGFAKATARIRDTGRRWRNLWACVSAMPDSPPYAASLGRRIVANFTSSDRRM